VPADDDHAAFAPGRAVVKPPGSPFVDPRQRFLDRLQNRLSVVQAQLRAADLGRGPAGLVWFLTLQLRNGSLISLQAPTSVTDFPHSEQLSDEIAQRIIVYLQHNGLG
jgi:hypothetical protein